MTVIKNLKKIGILVGGGPAPGINSVIHSVTMEAYRNGIEVLGIYYGFKNLMDGKLIGEILSPSRVAYIYGEGGAILHSARANPSLERSKMAACGNALIAGGIDGLVSIGGDDTAFSAMRVAEYAQKELGFSLRSAHIPKTIDNDLPLPEGIPTFGYETAREVGTRLVMNLKRDAATISNWFLVLCMGRHAGHLALGIGQSATATMTLIPEEWGTREIRLKEIVDLLVTCMVMRLAEGKPYGVAILAEGILEKLSHLDLESLDNVERDEHGHIRLAEVNFLDILKREVDKELVRLGIRIKLVKQVLGYELRCAPPCAYDIEYTRHLGEAAVDFLLDGGSNAIITIQQGEMVPIPYLKMINPETGKTNVRLVDIHSFRYQSAYKFMTRLKREHFLDEVSMEKYASIAHSTLAEFLGRYGYLKDHMALD